MTDIFMKSRPHVLVLIALLTVGLSGWLAGISPKVLRTRRPPRP